MIYVVRSTKPDILWQKEDDWINRLAKALDRYRNYPNKANKRALDVAFNRYRHDSVKQKLRRMFNEKCAYCESHIAHVSYSHIEHYQPKSRYPNKTFQWKNLLLACGICNGAEYKGEKFPQKRQGGPYINPTLDIRPEDHLSFEYDPQTKTANIHGRTRRGVKTEIDLGLNRLPLLKHRSFVVRKIVYTALKVQQNPLDAEGVEILRESVSLNSEYAAFARTIVNKLNLHL